MNLKFILKFHLDLITKLNEDKSMLMGKNQRQIISGIITKQQQIQRKRDELRRLCFH
jgi:predicted transposase YbfD/YdcC